MFTPKLMDDVKKMQSGMQFCPERNDLWDAIQKYDAAAAALSGKYPAAQKGKLKRDLTESAETLKEAVTSAAEYAVGTDSIRDAVTAAYSSAISPRI